MEISNKVCKTCGQYLYINYEKFGNPYYVCVHYLKGEEKHSSYLDIIQKTKQEENQDQLNREELDKFVKSPYFKNLPK